MASLIEGLLLTAFWCFVAWALILRFARERRLRGELPSKIRSRALRCPICGDPLPAWSGVFEACPYDPVHATYGITGGNEKGGGPPESNFRLRCARCDRDIWFSAWLDGTIRLHLGWLVDVSGGCEANWRRFIFP